MKQRGIVLELQENKAIVLTPAGKFLQVPVSLPLPDIGSEIDIIDTAASKQPGSRPWSRWVWGAAAAVLILLLSSLLLYQPWSVGEAVAYVGVDINPSVEIAIDSREKVVSTRTFNADGEELLAGTDFAGVHVERAIRIITDRSITKGYLTPVKENTIVITVVSKNSNLDRSGLESKLKQNTVDFLKQKNLGATVSTIAADPELRQASQAAGLSPGKYAILVESLDAGLQLTPDDFQKNSIAKAIKMVGGNPGEIIGKAHQENKFGEKAERFRDVLKRGNDVDITVNADGDDERKQDRGKKNGDRNDDRNDDARKDDKWKNNAQKQKSGRGENSHRNNET